MLIVYPFAFLTGAFGFRVAAAVSRRRDLDQVSQHLVPAGVAAGLIAAVPGLLDYLNTVPPRSSGKRRAATHGLLNTASLGLFTMSWVLGRNGRSRALPLVLQGAASAAMSVAGYMGGTLVYRNQIAVDHRYANAGRWREISSAGSLQPMLPAPEGQQSALPAELLAAADHLGVDQMTLVHVDGMRVAVGRTEEVRWPSTTAARTGADRCRTA